MRWILFSPRVFFLTYMMHFAIQTTAEDFTSLLQQHVDNGDVRYSALCKDPRLAEYIESLAKSNPDSISSQNEKLAFWLNAYNAYTLKIVCDHYPLKSINDLNPVGPVISSMLNKTVWDRDFVVINGQKMTLNDIEHKTIRPIFRDPRAHFALVCASKSCPGLRSEAFQGSRLNEQLDDQGRNFLQDPKRNRFDPEAKRARLSKIFEWYGNDFGKKQEDRLLFFAKFLPDPIADSIRKNPSAWKISYLDYDWSLNDK